jgi:ubiquinone/menaquinone biosynthesis C-methylase UbiE
MYRSRSHAGFQHREIGPEEYADWRKSVLGEVTERIEQKAMFDLAGDLRGKRVLDVGCGDGSYSILAARRGAHVVGVDRSLGMLESAQRRASACGVCVQWCQASAESLPFPSGSFDVVMAVTLLCFGKEPLLAAQEASRVLRLGGSLVVGELGRYSSWALLRGVRGLFGSSLWHGAHFWTLSRFRELLQQAGLQFRASHSCVYYPPIGLAALILGNYDGSFSFLGPIGAAFLVISGTKPVGTAAG